MATVIASPMTKPSRSWSHGKARLAATTGIEPASGVIPLLCL